MQPRWDHSAATRPERLQKHCCPSAPLRVHSLLHKGLALLEELGGQQDHGGRAVANLGVLPGVGEAWGMEEAKASVRGPCTAR